MKSFSKLAFIFCSLLLSSSCIDQKKLLHQKFDRVEDMLSFSPDSALSILSKTDTGLLDSEKLKARYSLLKSIALDKNKIDICSDSIIAEAVSYYSSKGNECEKARTFYYTARIFENAGEYDEAMRWLVKAEHTDTREDCVSTKVLVYASKGRIYHSALDYANAMSNYNLAAEYSRKDGDREKYVANMLRKADCQMMLEEYDSAKETIDMIKADKEELSIRNLNKMYQGLIFLNERKSPGKVESIRNEYLSVITDPKLVDWLMIAGTYINENDAAKAEKALEKQAEFRGTNASYHYRMAQVNELKGDYRKAFESYRKYDALSGKIGRSILTEDTRFIERQEEKDEMYEKSRMKNTILILAICAGLLLLAASFMFILIIRKKLLIKESENASLRKQFEELMMEREVLSKAETKNSEGMKIINERLRIIDQFVMSEALNDSFFEAKASKTLNDIINDRKEFIRHTRLIFETSYPQFTGYLMEKGLNETELEFCCLYAIGLNGKMVTSFTNMKRHYHIGSGIRKKLGLGGHDTNLSIYIRNLLNELEYCPASVDIRLIPD